MRDEPWEWYHKMPISLDIISRPMLLQKCLFSNVLFFFFFYPLTNRIAKSMILALKQEKRGGKKKAQILRMLLA